MINIIKQFPFELCGKCKRISPKLDYATWFSGPEVIVNEINIGCNNEELCREIYQMMEGEGKNEDLQEGQHGVQPAEEDTAGPGSGSSQTCEASGQARTEVSASGAAH